MKKLIVLSAIAALTSGSVFAEALDVGGSVPSVCKVITSSNAVTFPSLIKGSTSSFPFSLQCNDADGATVSLTSSEGHLQTVDGQDGTGVGYTAKVDAAPYSFTLSALSGVNDQSESDSHGGSTALATGGVTGSILLTVQGTPLYAGFYKDQLTLAITAN